MKIRKNFDIRILEQGYNDMKFYKNTGVTKKQYNAMPEWVKRWTLDLQSTKH